MTVELAAALACIDQARHLIDGRHDVCTGCGAKPSPRIVVDETGRHATVEADHAEDCAVVALAAAAERIEGTLRGT